MELTRRQLKEDFKPYKLGPYADKDFERNSSYYITDSSYWTPYDIDEARMYHDSSNFQLKKVIQKLERSSYAPYTFDAYRLREAKLELINRN